MSAVRETSIPQLFRALIAAALLALMSLAATPAPAQTITPTDAVTRLFEQEQDINDGWFGEAFLAQVPVERLRSVVDMLTAQFGAFVEVTAGDGQLTTRLERATMPTQIVLDADGRIIGLSFGTPVPTGLDLGALVAQIAALPGTSSVLVTTNGTVVAGYQADMPLAVGSAFKLAVLAALEDEVAAGRLHWDDVVTLDPALRSVPTGILQAWPDSPVTLAVLANLMISISDNTATDNLISILRRDRVEAVSPRNTPFLTTGELFRLKTQGNEALLQQWIAGDEDARRELLKTVDRLPLPAAEQLSPAASPEAEWLMTATEICALLQRVGGNPAFEINPGIADASDWAHVAFKGGSEVGVLNLSTLVTTADGTTHCVVATWNNDAALDDQALFVPYGGILAALAGSGASAPASAGAPNSAYEDGTITVPVPADFTLATTADEVAVQGVIPPCDEGFAACIYFSGSEYDGTNLESAGIRISLRPDLPTRDACLGTQPTGYDELVPNIGAAAGYATSVFAGLGDGGAGHYAAGDLYRLAVAGSCYEFETRIGQTQFANYDPGTIQEFTADDEAALRSALAAIVNGVTLADGAPVTFPEPAGD